MAITVQDAVRFAKKYLSELYADDPPKDLALEEIELSDQGGSKVWAVTLGFHRNKRVTAVPSPRHSLFSLEPPLPQVEHRVYKTIQVDAESGAFVKMDMRLVS